MTVYMVYQPVKLSFLACLSMSFPLRSWVYGQKHSLSYQQYSSGICSIIFRQVVSSRFLWSSVQFSITYEWHNDYCLERGWIWFLSKVNTPEILHGMQYLLKAKVIFWGNTSFEILKMTGQTYMPIIWIEKANALSSLVMARRGTCF